MANKTIVAVHTIETGKPGAVESIAPGDETSLPAAEATRLVDTGHAKWPERKAKAKAKAQTSEDNSDGEGDGGTGAKEPGGLPLDD